MIRIKEAYRLLRRNKRESIITITKIFIPAEIANSIVKRMYSLFFILESTYSITTLIICFAFFAQHAIFPAFFVQFFFLSFRALYSFIIIIIVVIIIIIIHFFVREEKRDKIDLVLMTLVKTPGTRGLPIKRPRSDALVIRIRCRADCNKIYPNRMISLFDNSTKYFTMLGQRFFFIYTSNFRRLKAQM